MNKEDVLYIKTIEYYSTMRKKKTQPFATTQMKFGGIMPSEISQTEKDKYRIISRIGINFKKPNSQKQSRFVTARGAAGVVEGRLEEGGQKVQTSSYEINKY